MTLEELKVKDVYELAHGIRYRIPVELTEKSEKEIRNHLIYANTLIMLNNNKCFNIDLLFYYQYLFNFQELDKIKEKTAKINIGDYFTIEVPSSELKDYQIINKAINDFNESKKEFYKTKSIYEEFVRIFYDTKKLEDFVIEYLSNNIDILGYTNLNSNDAYIILRKHVLLIKQSKIRASLIKFISEEGKPTFGPINVRGEEEETTINMIQNTDEIGLLINIFPHKHYVFIFKLNENGKINQIDIINPAYCNYYNFKSIDIELNIDNPISKNN